jgi:hypothetical protein
MAGGSGDQPVNGSWTMDELYCFPLLKEVTKGIIKGIPTFANRTIR